MSEARGGSITAVRDEESGDRETEYSASNAHKGKLEVDDYFNQHQTDTLHSFLCQELEIQAKTNGLPVSEFSYQYPVQSMLSYLAPGSPLDNSMLLSDCGKVSVDFHKRINRFF